MKLPYFSWGWVELIHSPAIWLGAPHLGTGFAENFKVTRAIAEGDTIGREVEDNAKARVGI